MAARDLRLGPGTCKDRGVSAAEDSRGTEQRSASSGATVLAGEAEQGFPWPEGGVANDDPAPVLPWQPVHAAPPPARSHRDRDRLVLVLVLLPFVMMGLFAASAWLGDRAGGGPTTPPEEFEAAAHQCVVAVAEETGAGLVSSTVQMTVGDRFLRVDGVPRADTQRVVRCEVTWSPGFSDVEVSIEDAPTAM